MCAPYTPTRGRVALATDAPAVKTSPGRRRKPITRTLHPFDEDLPMPAIRIARVRRLVADLAHAERRGDAVNRIRRRAGSALRRVAGRSTPDHRSRTPGGQPASHTRPDRWYVREWSRLANAVLGAEDPARANPVDPARATDVLKLAARHRADAALATAIARGEGLERAVCDAVDALTRVLEWQTAWSIAEGAGRLPGGTDAARLGRAVLHHRRRQFDRAWNVIRPVDGALLASVIPVEAVDAALADGSAEGRRRALAIATPADSMPNATLVDLAGRCIAVGERDRAAELLSALRGRSGGNLDPRREHAVRWIEGALAATSPELPAGAISVGVLGYGSPDHVQASDNLGDAIETLAMLGNLVRFSDVRFSGEDGLGQLATGLQARVDPAVRRPGMRASVHLVPVDRDLSSVAHLPAPTWTIAFGWHMHPLFDIRFDFPYHPDIRPLFVSFHVNRHDMLSEEARAYLRRYGPIGCRDWSTVFLLLSAGIDAFFTGDFSATVDALFPARSAAYGGSGAVGVIDLPRRSAPRGATDIRLYSQQSDAYRFGSLAGGLRVADQTLGAYQRDLQRAVTGRLHAYLPLVSLGVPVEFKPANPGDIRFAGLTGMRPADPRLDAMRTDLRALVDAAFEPILRGASEDAVYRRWREATANAVAEAKIRFHEPVEVAPTTIDVAAAAAASRDRSRRFGPHDSVDPSVTTDVVVAFDQNLTTPAAVLLESIVANASGPIRAWILARGLDAAYQEWLAGAFPALPITFLPCDHISFHGTGRRPRIPSRITLSTMDRLLLPAILHEVDRVVYLDVDTLVLGDIRELATMDLKSYPIAARDSNVTESSEWQRAVRPIDEPVATELRRQLGARDGFGTPALNAGVLVLDLERLRRDDFSTRFLGWVERYGLHDQDTMLAYVGPQRAVIDPRWNAMPVIEDVHGPRLIHWASFGKPWDPELTFEQERWRAVAARLHERAGTAPVATGPAEP
jgi:lipopolysaccharide biosynthesis glycosyltransferase